MRSKNNGITLITLVITIIVMMILAGVTVSTLTGDNGLITKAIEAKEKSKMAAIKEQVDFVKMEWDMDKMLNPSLTISDFWAKLVEQGIIDSADDDVEETETGVYTIITKDGYEIEVTVDSNGNIQIGDIASGNELLHKIKVTGTSTNSITVKATVGRKYSSAKLSYYYKQDGDDDYTELDGKQNTSDLEVTFPDLLDGTKYHIKVVAKSGKETATLETTGTTIIPGATEGLTEGNIVASTTWNKTTNKATMTLTTETDYQIQWQKDTGRINDNSWTPESSPVEIPNLELNDTIIARLYDGKNGGSYAAAKVSDGKAHDATIDIPNAVVTPGGKITATVTLNDDESGVNRNACRWVFTESSNKLGETSSKFSTDGEEFDASGKVEWTPPATSGKTYWLHVLTVDNAGNKLETVSEQSVIVGIIPTTTTGNGNITFDTSYGLIDILWLDGVTNTISETPNLPTESDLSGMTKVTWTKSGTSWSEDGTAKDSEWGKYNAGTGTADNTSSQWANAKRTADGSYYVWIPRYAYRIKYYSDANYTNLTGYYDGYGMWKADTGELRVAIDEGVEKVTAPNGDKYIVHPAFTDNVDLGGWKTPIRGFWTAKYEMSQETKSGSTWSPSSTGNETAGNVETSSTIRAVSKPYTSSSSVTSWRNITIGNCYTNSYNYDRAKESHLMKNSEWGAIAYLTQSTYGRNGHEITTNSVGTTTGGGSSYNTTSGALQSTTGNIYGVYDMSGGAWDYVAAYDVKGGSNISNGSSFASSTGTSNEYATVYSNGTSTYQGNDIIFKVGKVGDATKEVNAGGTNAVTSTTASNNWFSDYSYVVYSNGPFFLRGARYDYGAGAGVFASSRGAGYAYSSDGFRVVLVP